MGLGVGGRGELRRVYEEEAERWQKEQQRVEEEIQSEWRDIVSLREGRIKGHQK